MEASPHDAGIDLRQRGARNSDVLGRAGGIDIEVKEYRADERNVVGALELREIDVGGQDERRPLVRARTAVGFDSGRQRYDQEYRRGTKPFVELASVVPVLVVSQVRKILTGGQLQVGTTEHGRLIQLELDGLLKLSTDLVAPLKPHRHWSFERAPLQESGQVDAGGELP